DVSRRAGPGGGDLQPGPAHPVAVKDIDLPPPEADLLAGAAGRLLRGIAWGLLVEENGHRLARRGVQERVSGYDRRHLGRGAHQHADGLPGVAREGRLQCGLDPGLGLPARKDDVSARDVGPDLEESGPLAQALEVAHRQLAGAADVDGPE